MDVIRLIASDLDATLLDDQSQLPPDFAETVRALAERGIRFAAASGRPIYTLEEMFAPLQDDIILVGDNGGAICWKGESLYLSEMDAADWHTLAGQARSAGHAAVLCGLETAYVEEQFRPYDRVFKRFYTKVEYVPHLEDVTARVDKFTIYFPEGDAQKGYDALYGPVWGGRFSVAVAGADWVDIMNPGVHKGAALLRLGECLGVLPEGMTLCVTDTRASHSELTGEFAAIRNEMEAVAACLDGRVLGEVEEKRFWQELPRLREQCGDRAVLRAIHYFEENARTLAQRDALVAGDFAAFARLVEKSGHSSFECCQNVYCASSPKHQGLSAALAISQSILAGTGGAWRMQGGGFAGTIQAFVPDALVKRYCAAMEALFGPGCCYLLSLREQGAVRVM